jgi:hypothetical protein
MGLSPFGKTASVRLALPALVDGFSYAARRLTTR